MKNVEIEVDLKTLEEFDILSYELQAENRGVLKSVKEVKVPVVSKDVGDLTLTKESIDSAKVFKKYLIITGFILIASFVLPVVLRLFSPTASYISNILTAGGLLALYVIIIGRNELDKINNVTIQSYKLGEMLQSKFLKQITWEPKQFLLIGYMIENKLDEIGRGKVRELFGFDRSALSESKTPLWLKTIFSYNDYGKVFKRKNVKFKIIDKLDAKIKEEIGNQLSKLFVVRCLVALKRGKRRESIVPFKTEVYDKSRK